MSSSIYSVKEKKLLKFSVQFPVKVLHKIESTPEGKTFAHRLNYIVAEWVGPFRRDAGRNSP